MATIEVLIVGAGGNGGSPSNDLLGKGGGAGGEVKTGTFVITESTYTVSVGDTPGEASSITGNLNGTAATEIVATGGASATGNTGAINSATNGADGGNGGTASTAATAGQDGYESSISGTAKKYGAAGGGGASPTYPNEASGGNLNAGTGGEVCHNLILDMVPNCKAAYSAARKLRTGVTNAFYAIRGNSSPAGFFNIAFSGNEGVEASLNAFAAFGPNTELKLKTWYDQSTNANHITTSSDWGDCATLYRSGLGGVLKQGGKPTVRFAIDNNNNYYISASATQLALLTGEYTMFMVARPENNIIQVLGNGAGNGSANSALRLGTTSHFVADNAGTDVTAAGTSSFSFITAYKRGSDREIKINGSTVSTTTTGSTRNSGIDQVGGFSIYSPTYHKGDISEILLWDRALTDAEIKLVEDSIKTFYGIS